MPRVYTTLLKVTRIRLRISMTDCASLTSVCVAVADDAILTCSAAGDRRGRESGVQSSGRPRVGDWMVVVKGVGDGLVGIPVSPLAPALRSLTCTLQNIANCAPSRAPRASP